MQLFEEEDIRALRNELQRTGLTIAVAESVTGGFIQAALSTAEDARLFFQGGITAYNLGQKCRHLAVNPVEAEEKNSVSKEIAQQMALEVCSLFCAGLGVAITGYAAPVPELGIRKPFAWFALAGQGKILRSGRLFPDPTKKDIPAQVYYTNAVIRECISALRKKTQR